MDDKGRKDGRDATGRTQAAAFRFTPADLQKLRELVAAHLARTGIATNRTKVLQKLIADAHKKLPKS